MKSKELKTYNLPSDNPLISVIDAKPSYLFFILIGLGLIIMVLDFPGTYGLILICFATVALIYTPRAILMEFYNDYLIMYNKADRTSCVLIYYDEISSWNYVRGANHDYLNIGLNDGQEETIEAFSKTVFEGNMNRFVKDKNRKNMQ